jgi:hypothetical protein
MIVMGYLSFFPRFICFPIAILVARSYGTCEAVGMSVRNIVISTCDPVEGEQMKNAKVNVCRNNLQRVKIREKTTCQNRTRIKYQCLRSS